MCHIIRCVLKNLTFLFGAIMTKTPYTLYIPVSNLYDLFDIKYENNSETQASTLSFGYRLLSRSSSIIILECFDNAMQSQVDKKT